MVQGLPNLVNDGLTKCMEYSKNLFRLFSCYKSGILVFYVSQQTAPETTELDLVHNIIL